MKKPLLRIGFFFCLVLLISCSDAREANNLPSTRTVDSVEASPTPLIDHVQESPPPTTAPDWDDKAIFLQTLSPTGQESLSALPQASVYHISLTIPDDMTEPLKGWLQVRYFNQEAIPLNDIYFRLFPNYYGGLLQTTDLKIDGLPAKGHVESGRTALRVELSSPLPPGESVVISMAYELIVPETMSGNYGLLGFFEGILVLDTFYPMIPAYDENGWYAHYPYQNGDLTYTDASFYLVEVTAPADIVLASSGSVVEEVVQDGKQYLKIASGPARDFYLAGSKRFEVVSRKFDDITVNSYALREDATIQEIALNVSGQALQIFSDLFGAYPYTEFDVLSSPMLALGIEYPGITAIYLELYDEDGTTYGMSNQALIESVIAHEVGHQWFYNLVGSDQQSEPWVDEALTQYVTYQYFVQAYGASAGDGVVQSWYDRWARLENQEMPIGLIASDYGDTAYSPIVYGRGPLFFLMLEEQFGEDQLLDSLKTYAEKFQWSTANTENLKTSLEASCNCDLTEVFEEWIYPAD